MLNFGAIPPEIISAKMYAGPGSGSLLAAAAAWNALSAELHSAVGNYESVITSLVAENWLGPSAEKMAAAVQPYLAWLAAAAVQTEHVGASAAAAATAYEAAFAATVPPTVISANRTLLANLLASNLFGQNAGAIAAANAQYAEMWAQNSATMTSYAIAARAAGDMTPFSQPRADTAQDAAAGQAAAVNQAGSAAGAAAAPAPTGIWSWLGLAPGSDTSTTGLAGVMNLFSNSNENLLGAFLNNNSVGGLSNAFTTNGILNPTTFIDPAATAAANGAITSATTSGLEDLAAGLGNVGLASSVAKLPGAAATAGLGQASLVGTLSVPTTWADTGATVSTVAATTKVGAAAYHGFGAATPMVMEGAGAVGMPGVPLAGIPGSPEDEFADPIYGFRPRVIGRPPAAG